MSSPTRRGTRLLFVGALTVGLAACGGLAVPDLSPGAQQVTDVDATPGSTDPATGEPTEEPTTEPTSRPTATPVPTSGTGATPTPAPTEEPQQPTEEPAPTVLERGHRGPAVRQVQQRLLELGYWLGAADGVYGHLTEQAVLAFQGWEGIARDGRVGPQTRQRLAEAGRPVPDGDGDLVEVHRSQGVLLVVRDGATRWAIHTSTGSGEYYTQPDGDRALADTPAGTWTVDWQVDGWRESFLGRLWRPKYFHEHGLAIHGYPEVPAWPASHGCARVSMEAMDLIWEQELAPVGTTVVVS